MKLYLAGPDVFRPDMEAWAKDARERCARYGHDALLPVDGTETTAEGIYRANIALIQKADAVLANLNPFRGCEPDSGTCFEVGYAVALGRPVIAYVDSDDTIVARVTRQAGGSLARANGRTVDQDGWTIEDFGSPLNLMLSIPSTVVVGGLEAALKALDGEPARDRGLPTLGT